MNFEASTGEFFLESEIGRPSAENAFFHVIPVPFEASVSYEGGTRRGPEAIINASQQLELFDGFSSPGRLGIFTHEALNAQPSNASSSENNAKLVGSTSIDAQAHALFQTLQERVAQLFAGGHMPIVLGGEHSISYAPIMAALNHCAGRGGAERSERHQNKRANLGIVQIDAHADMRLNYEGKVWSHASVMRRCAGIPIAQIGVRALCKEEQDYREAAPEVCFWNAQATAQNISLPENFPENIYLTIDVDGLDPSIMPATGTPVPGGLQWYQTLSILETIISQRNVIAFDCVELAPQKGLHYADFTAAQLIYNVMGYIERSAQNRA